jgi:SAM-dependent methyltransferase
MAESKFYDQEISTYEQSVLEMRSSPQHADFIRREFLDRNFAAAAERFADSEFFTEIVELITESGAHVGAHILDLGGGRGLLSYALRKKGYRVTLCEISRSPITGLGAIDGHQLELHATCANGEALPFPEYTFDLVICKQMLHHTTHPRHLLAEAHRVLKAAGATIAYKEHCLPWYGGKKRFLANHEGARYGAQENAFRTITYARAFRDSGYEKVRLWDIDTIDQLRSEYLASDAKRKLIALPLVGEVLFRLAYLKYYYWRYWCSSPGQTMNFIARKSG